MVEPTTPQTPDAAAVDRSINLSLVMKFFTKTAPPGGDTIGFEPTAYDIRALCVQLACSTGSPITREEVKKLLADEGLLENPRGKDPNLRHFHPKKDLEQNTKIRTGGGQQSRQALWFNGAPSWRECERGPVRDMLRKSTGDANRSTVTLSRDEMIASIQKGKAQIPLEPARMEKKRKACVEGEEGDPQAENARLQQQLQELTAENAQLTKLGSGPVHFAAITPSTPDRLKVYVDGGGGVRHAKIAGKVDTTGKLLSLRVTRDDAFPSRYVGGQIAMSSVCTLDTNEVHDPTTEAVFAGKVTTPAGTRGVAISRTYDPDHAIHICSIPIEREIAVEDDDSWGDAA